MTSVSAPVPSPCSTFRHGGAPRSSGSNSTTRPAAVFGEPGQDVGDRVAFGVDEHRAAARGRISEHLPGEQGGFPGPGGADDPQVVPPVGDGQGDRPGCAGVGHAERAGVRAGHRDAGRRRHRPCPGPGQAGHGRVSGQGGEGGQLGH